MWVFVCMFICVGNVCVCAFMFACICVCVCFVVCLYVCVCVFVCVSLCVYMYLCLTVCMSPFYRPALPAHIGQTSQPDV